MWKRWATGLRLGVKLYMATRTQVDVVLQNARNFVFNICPFISSRTSCPTMLTIKRPSFSLPYPIVHRAIGSLIARNRLILMPRLVSLLENTWHHPSLKPLSQLLQMFRTYRFAAQELRSTSIRAKQRLLQTASCYIKFTPTLLAFNKPSVPFHLLSIPSA